MMTPEQVLQHGIKVGAFPGAVAWLGRGGEALFHGNVGNLGYEVPYTVPTGEAVLYDLASVTKVYTLTVALLVARDYGLELEETRVSDFYPCFPSSISLEHLLQHTAGLGLELQRLEAVGAEDWLPKLAAAPLRFEPGSQVSYSCSNYFVLARVLEEVTGTSLDRLMGEYRLTGPEMLFAPALGQTVAPTEARPEGGFWQGEVHDEAARSWRRQTGTCAGNAGLFGTARAVAAFGQLWLDPEGVLTPELLEPAFRRPVPENSYHRVWGWQVDARFYMGDHAPAGTIGHLGFTGPSLVLNRTTRHMAVILSNRVHPTRNGPDRLPFYCQLHDWLFQLA
jgi:CubicO group peptidase (beta-lactamase class C family)